jgi:hypothetical protein
MLRNKEDDDLRDHGDGSTGALLRVETISDQFPSLFCVGGHEEIVCRVGEWFLHVAARIERLNLTEAGICSYLRTLT